MKCTCHGDVCTLRYKRIILTSKCSIDVCRGGMDIFQIANKENKIYSKSNDRY